MIAVSGRRMATCPRQPERAAERDARPPPGLPFRVMGARPRHPRGPDEYGETLENAPSGARLRPDLGHLTVADDSGSRWTALGGEPGSTRAASAARGRATSSGTSSCSRSSRPAFEMRGAHFTSASWPRVRRVLFQAVETVHGLIASNEGRERLRVRPALLLPAVRKTFGEVPRSRRR